MSTIDHAGIRVADLEEGRAFYDRVFSPLGLRGEDAADPNPFIEWGDFAIEAADAEHPPTTGLHVAFTAASEALVERWWQSLVEAGHRSDGEPGPRPQYSPTYYGAFILDPDGNSVEAVTHESARERASGAIDHLWIRVAELEPVKRFYAAVAPTLDLELHDRGERFSLDSESGSFTFLEGEPTRDLHLAIGVRDRATVDAFHRAALAAGAADNGAPGLRPQYHAGYYGAFVIDPSGTNLEAVHHTRDAGSTSVASLITT